MTEQEYRREGSRGSPGISSRRHCGRIGHHSGQRGQATATEDSWLPAGGESHDDCNPLANTHTPARPLRDTHRDSPAAGLGPLPAHDAGNQPDPHYTVKGLSLIEEEALTFAP